VVSEFLLTAGTIGALFKKGASISAAGMRLKDCVAIGLFFFHCNVFHSFIHFFFSFCDGEFFLLLFIFVFIFSLSQKWGAKVRLASPAQWLQQPCALSMAARRDRYVTQLFFVLYSSVLF
jgi:hypothetical protein